MGRHTPIDPPIKDNMATVQNTQILGGGTPLGQRFTWLVSNLPCWGWCPMAINRSQTFHWSVLSIHINELYWRYLANSTSLQSLDNCSMRNSLKMLCWVHTAPQSFCPLCLPDITAQSKSPNPSPLTTGSDQTVEAVKTTPGYWNGKLVSSIGLASISGISHTHT